EAGAAADRRTDPGPAGATLRDRAGDPRRIRRVAAVARPRRPQPGRVVRSLPAAHTDRRGPPAVPGRRTRPAGHRGSRRTAAAAARPAAQARLQGVRTARQGTGMKSSRTILLACLAAASLLAA